MKKNKTSHKPELSEMERKTAILLLQDYSLRDIALILHRSLFTVEGYCKNIRKYTRSAHIYSALSRLLLSGEIRAEDLNG